MRRIIATSAVTIAALAAVPGTAVAAQTAAPAPTTITPFHLATEASGRFTVSGRLNSPGMVVKDKPLVLEYASKRTGKWYQYQYSAVGAKTLRTTAGGNFKGSYFIGTVGPQTKPRPIGVNNGYWRVRFAGDATVAASSSAVAYDPRIDAGIAGFKIKPRTIRKGAYISVYGTLMHRPAGVWKPYRGQVYILGVRKGAKTWYWYARPKTNTKGQFSARFRVHKDSYFMPMYYGDRTHYAGNRWPLFVNVR
ncbi:hypothetical protein [Spirillospora sp. CA-294931]|uniref:hypothetical protein n=1 Tax=Spirillospora sp. CA-294931 TaxID=3240042 RepID=UPI003D8E6132